MTERPKNGKKKGLLMSEHHGKLPVRGYLIHMTHYDPVWCAAKETEAPFDLAVARRLVQVAAENRLNLLMIDVKDAVRYDSHPELARHYTQPKSVLTDLAQAARDSGLEVALKLNFSQSAVHQHNHWFRPHNQLFDNDEYWDRAWRIVDELLEAARPEQFFHIGMDEDHWRSYTQYIEAIDTLQKGLQQRGLRTVIWNDSACDWPAAHIHKEKSLFAEESVSREIVHVVWDYAEVKSGIYRRIREHGFELWGAPGKSSEAVGATREALIEHDGEGILLTTWKPCVQKHEGFLVTHLQGVGPLCSENRS